MSLSFSPLLVFFEWKEEECSFAEGAEFISVPSVLGTSGPLRWLRSSGPVPGTQDEPGRGSVRRVRSSCQGPRQLEIHIGNAWDAWEFHPELFLVETQVARAEFFRFEAARRSLTCQTCGVRRRRLAPKTERTLRTGHGRPPRCLEESFRASDVRDRFPRIHSQPLY